MKHSQSTILIFHLIFFFVSVKANQTKGNYFIENKGQWPEEVKYLAQVGAMNAWITNDGVVYDYYLVDRNFDKSFLVSLANNEFGDFTNLPKNVKSNIIY